MMYGCFTHIVRLSQRVVAVILVQLGSSTNRDVNTSFIIMQDSKDTMRHSMVGVYSLHPHMHTTLATGGFVLGTTGLKWDGLCLCITEPTLVLRTGTSTPQQTGRRTGVRARGPRDLALVWAPVGWLRTSSTAMIT